MGQDRGRSERMAIVTSAASYASGAELPRTNKPPKKWRVGNPVGRTIYIQEGDEASEQDTLIGMMDTSAQAMLVVIAVNSCIDLQDNSKSEQEEGPDDKGYIEFLENRLREKERRIEMLKTDLAEKRALAIRLREELDHR